jgi:hypothetical protein
VAVAAHDESKERRRRRLKRGGKDALVLLIALVARDAISGLNEVSLNCKLMI